MGRRESKTGWERLREREDREEQEREEAREQERQRESSRQQSLPGQVGAASLVGQAAEQLRQNSTAERIEELLQRLEPMLEQLHMLYLQYYSGVEKLPPVERRKQVDQAFQSLALAPKNSSLLQFRCNTLQSRYRTYVEQWERQARDLESGKLRRRVPQK